MKKITAVFLASALSLSLLSGCGNKVTPPSNSSSKVESTAQTSSADDSSEWFDVKYSAQPKILKSSEGVTVKSLGRLLYSHPLFPAIDQNSLLAINKDANRVFKFSSDGKYEKAYESLKQAGSSEALLRQGKNYSIDHGAGIVYFYNSENKVERSVKLPINTATSDKGNNPIDVDASGKYALYSDTDDRNHLVYYDLQKEQAIWDYSMEQLGYKSPIGVWRVGFVADNLAYIHITGAVDTTLIELNNPSKSLDYDEIGLNGGYIPINDHQFIVRPWAGPEYTWKEEPVKVLHPQLATYQNGTITTEQINDDDQFAEAAFSPNKEFVALRGLKVAQDGSHIYTLSVRSTKDFTEVWNASFAHDPNNPHNNSALTVSDDGKTVYWINQSGIPTPGLFFQISAK